MKVSIYKPNNRKIELKQNNKPDMLTSHTAQVRRAGNRICNGSKLRFTISGGSIVADTTDECLLANSKVASSLHGQPLYPIPVEHAQ